MIVFKIVHQLFLFLPSIVVLVTLIVSGDKLRLEDELLLDATLLFSLDLPAEPIALFHPLDALLVQTHTNVEGVRVCGGADSSGETLSRDRGDSVLISVSPFLQLLIFNLLLLGKSRFLEVLIVKPEVDA